MKTNKMLPDSSISKVWENFRKMNGIVIEFLVSNWVSQSNGTYTNTIFYEGFTSDEILEVDLYDDGTLTETQISEYDGYITEFNVEDGKIIAFATTKPTQTIKILARGEIVGKMIVNGGDSSNISASNVSCLDKDGKTSNVQKELDEQNKNMGGLRFGVDGDGNYGYYGADDSLIPFSNIASLKWGKVTGGAINAVSTIDLGGKPKQLLIYGMNSNTYISPVLYYDGKTTNILMDASIGENSYFNLSIIDNGFSISQSLTNAGYTYIYGYTI